MKIRSVLKWQIKTYAVKIVSALVKSCTRMIIIRMAGSGIGSQMEFLFFCSSQTSKNSELHNRCYTKNQHVCSAVRHIFFRTSSPSFRSSILQIAQVSCQHVQVALTTPLFLLYLSAGHLMTRGFLTLRLCYAIIPFLLRGKPNLQNSFQFATDVIVLHNHKNGNGLVSCPETEINIKQLVFRYLFE